MTEIGQSHKILPRTLTKRNTAELLIRSLIRSSILTSLTSSSLAHMTQKMTRGTAMQARFVQNAVRYSSGWRTMSAQPWLEEKSVCSSTNVRMSSEQFSNKLSGMWPSKTSFGKATKVLLNCCNKLQSKSVEDKVEESMMIELEMFNFSGVETQAPLQYSKVSSRSLQQSYTKLEEGKRENCQKSDFYL